MIIKTKKKPGVYPSFVLQIVGYWLAVINSRYGLNQITEQSNHNINVIHGEQDIDHSGDQENPDIVLNLHLMRICQIKEWHKTIRKKARCNKPQNFQKDHNTPLLVIRQLVYIFATGSIRETEWLHLKIVYHRIEKP